MEFIKTKFPSWDKYWKVFSTNIYKYSQEICTVSNQNLRQILKSILNQYYKYSHEICNVWKQNIDKGGIFPGKAGCLHLPERQIVQCEHILTIKQGF